MERKKRLELNTEYPAAGEKELAEKIFQALRKSVESRFLQGLTYRGVNAKTHAAVRAELVVEPDLPDYLRVGLFKEPRSYPSWIRLSSTLPDPLPDSVRDLRGLAIKLMEVPGEKLLEGDRHGTTHDLIFITPDVFFTANPQQFLGFTQAGGLTAKKSLRDYVTLFWFLITHPAIPITILKSQKRIGSLLEVPWYSATPYLFGDRAVKYSLKPWLPLTTPAPANPANNYLREDLGRQLRETEAGFDLRIQFQLDPKKQPIEDALVPWREKDSPWHKIATVRIPRQIIDSPEQMLFAENLSMNPWRCLPEHRPLGGVNRVRALIYSEGSKFRHRRNVAPREEPVPERVPIGSEILEGKNRQKETTDTVGFWRSAHNFWQATADVLRLPQTVLGSVFLALTVVAVIGIGVWGYILYFPDLPAPVKVYDVVKLEQNWTDNDRQWYYHTSQGSQVMPYDWFMALEQPNNRQIFTDNEYITRMRFIPDPNPVQNKDLLPIGFAKDDPDPVTGIQNVGLTCALCHTSQLTYHGMGIRIDGAPGTFNFDTFLTQIVTAVAATVQPAFTERIFDPGKFDRFAHRVLKDKYSPETAAKLKSDVRAWLQEKIGQQIEQVGTDATTHQKATVASFGRLDALGTGGNRLYRQLTPSNLRTLNAPVTAFPLWYVYYYDWVQSNGSIRQPMSRNIIESLAVNAGVVLPGTPGKDDQYLSSVRMKNMWQMEDTAKKLAAPQWPAWIFGPIDQAKAAKGKQLYGQYCSSCHSPKLEPAPMCGDDIANRHRDRYFMLRLYSFGEIGTDPLDAENFATRTVDASAIGMSKNEPGPNVIKTVIGGILRKGFKDLNLPQAEQEEWSGYRADCWRAPNGYPARPLDGVWATAPFLHNNSVPNLYELLLPADKRSKTFHIGNPEFDPVRVGYVNKRIPGGFTVDTTKPGNSNAGHEFRNAAPGTKGVIGPELSDEQRWDLIEYLKIISEMPAAIEAQKNSPIPSGDVQCWSDPKWPAMCPAPEPSEPAPVSKAVTK
ncbi:MAG TPA: di-heme-cytochrome C peroxidase [Terracidiphilus sp.]|nr:di-heme-cytochrome C peroxidase [Terracidiphilus sp.]